MISQKPHPIIVYNPITIYHCIFFTESALEFTLTPDDPTHVLKGQNATLVWEYRVDDKEKELFGIVWSVVEKVTGNTINLFIETKSGDRSEVGGISQAYKGRVSVKEQATLVIANVTLNDSTTFRCTLRAESNSGVNEAKQSVQLVVTGMFSFGWNLIFFSEMIFGAVANF